MQLGVEVSGMRVTALNVDVGQHVRKGDVLLEVDHRTLEPARALAGRLHRRRQAGQRRAHPVGNRRAGAERDAGFADVAINQAPQRCSRVRVFGRQRLWG